MEPNDPLWKLLGKSPRLEPDPWFAARTLARCRRELTSSRWGLSWPGWGWLTALGCATALVLNIWGVPLKGTQNSAQIQEAFNYLVDRGGDSELWLE